MRIELVSGWYLTSDRRNYVLARMKKRKIFIIDPVSQEKIDTGEYEDHLEGEQFFSTIDNALKGLGEILLKSSEATTLYELKKDFEELNNYIYKIKTQLEFTIKNK